MNSAKCQVNSKNSLLCCYTLPKFLIACRATTFAKVDYSDNQFIVGAFCKRPHK